MAEGSEAGSAASLRSQVRAVMVTHWRPDGHTVPNAEVYPWQWLWDSCFHAIVWAELGEADRAVVELRAALADQDRLGFVPHIRYVGGSNPHARFWGRPSTSGITQPPMYGHAVAELVRRGVEVPTDVVERAELGVRFLLDRRARTAAGLVSAVHPWETGCDDSPRWDHWCGPPGWSSERWFHRKGTLIDTIERGPDGSPLANPGFGCGPAGFNALIAWNATELATVTGDRALASSAQAVADALDDRWAGELGTWVDDGPSAPTSGGVRSLDGLLPVLVCSSAGRALAGLGTALDDAAFGGPCGPAGVHRTEPAFDPVTYWRGPAWPPLTYLMWCAARRHGSGAATDQLADRLCAGAAASGLAEHWHPDTGAAGGAVPQSWAGLALCVDDSS